MNLALILSLLEQVPALIAAAQQIRDSLSQTDQAKLDAAIAAAQAAANADVTRLVADAKAAS